MISEYEFSEFKNKLTELTKDGYPMFKGNPFAMFTINFSSKPFYGNILSKEFKITKNSNVSPLPYLILGKFRKNGNFTEVNYEIKPMKFGHYWIRFFPIIGNIILLSVLFFNLAEMNIDFTEIKTYILIILFELFIFFPTYLTKLQLKNFESKFKKELKIKNHSYNNTAFVK